MILSIKKLPDATTPKDWARWLPTTESTSHLPTRFDNSRVTFTVDADYRHPDTVERFSLDDVAAAAMQIVSACFVRVSSGSGLISMDKEDTVWLTLRTTGRASEGHDMDEVRLLNDGKLNSTSNAK